MKILMISPQFRPLVGGYERAAERLSAALAARGHSITVVTERRERQWPAREGIDGVQIRRLWCRYRPRFHMLTSLASFALFLLTSGRHYHVWHVHQYGLHAVLAVLLGKFLHRPVLLKLTNSKDQGLRQTSADLPFSHLAQALLRRPDSVVALTRETLDEALAFGIPAERVHLLGNGVDIHAFRSHTDTERSRARQELGIQATGVVLFVGRLSREKNPDGLLIAWQQACSRLPAGWKLILIGDGSMSAELASSIKSAGLSRSVILAGQQDNVEVWMAASDIYVLASHHEGLSNTLLEAMTSGLPVVSTRVSGSAETLEEPGAGRVVDVGRMDQLATALVELASDPDLRRQMGLAGRAVIENRYAIERVAESHERLYRSLLGRNVHAGANA